MVIKHEVQLGDGVSKPAKDAAAEVTKLSKDLTLLTKSLASAEAKMTKAAATGNIAQYRAASKDVAAFKTQIGSLETQLAKLAPKEEAVATNMLSWQEELATATGGLSVLAEVAGAVVLGLGAITLAGAKFAIEASEAKTQAIAMFNALGEGKITGERVDDLLDDMRAKLGLTKEAMTPIVKSLLTMGITSDGTIQKMTQAAASAQALGGSSEAFLTLQKKIQASAESGQALKIKLQALAGVGLNVTDVAKQMGIGAQDLGAQLKKGTVDAKKFGDAMTEALIKKGAGPLATMSLSVSNLGGLLKEYIGDLFEDMGDSIKPFLVEVKSLFGILDSKANPSGKALKAGIEAFFRNVFAIATKVVPMIKHFLLDVIILGLKAYIAVKPIGKALVELYENHGGADKLSAALTAIVFVLKVAGTVVAIVVGAFAALFAVIAVTGLAIWSTIGAVAEFVTGAGKMLSDWAGSAVTVASDFVQGLANGITNGTGLVIDAAKNLGASALSGIKSVLGIASPSKEMAKLGQFSGEGLALGQESAVPRVESAATAMGSATMASAAGGAAAQSSGTASGGGTTQVTFAPGSIVIDGAGTSAQEITQEMIALVFERLALQAGR